MNQQITSNDFLKFVDEVRKSNKIELEDNKTTIKSIEKLGDKIVSTNEKVVGKISSKYQPTVKEELKAGVASAKRLGSKIASGFSSVGSGIKSLAKNPIEAIKAGGTAIGTKIADTEIAAEKYLEDIISTPKEYKLPTKEEKNKETETKKIIEKVASKKEESKNPEADNIETPAEIAADAAKDNVDLSKQLLDTTKESLTQLIAIKEALQAPQPKETTSKPTESTPLVQDQGGGLLDQFGNPFSKGGSTKPTSNATGKGAAPSPSSTPSKPTSKPSIGSKIMGGAKSVGSKILGAARFAGPAAAVGGAIVGGVQGYNRAGEVFGVEDKDATIGQKLSSAVGGIADPFGLGYGDSLARGIGSLFGVGKDKETKEELSYKEEKRTFPILDAIDKQIAAGEITPEQALKSIETHTQGGTVNGGKPLLDEAKRRYSGAKSETKLKEPKSDVESTPPTQDAPKSSVESTPASTPVDTMENREAGGPVTEGKPYIVGEEGPEVFVPKESGKISPTDAKVIDLGDGQKKKINPDGSYEISGGFGTKKYDAKGQLVSEVSPTVAGYSRETTADGNVTERYNAGPLSASTTTDSGGNITAKESSYDLGLAKVSASESQGKKAMTAEIRTGTEENAMLRDEMAAGGSTQPIVANNVSNTSTNNFMPMKADPRPTHRGSALDRYNERVAAY